MTAPRTSPPPLLLVLLLALTPACNAQKSTQASTLRQLHGAAAASLLRRADTHALPPGVRLDPVLQQSFTLASPGTASLGLIATWFHYEPAPPDPGPPSQCGLFLVPPDGSSQYVPTVGPAFQHGTNLCAGVRALGLADKNTAHPSLIAIFSGTGMHGDEYPLPFVFAWSETNHTYTLDESTSQRLQQGRAFAGTIPAVRRLLLHQPPA